MAPKNVRMLVGAALVVLIVSSLVLMLRRKPSAGSGVGTTREQVRENSGRPGRSSQQTHLPPSSSDDPPSPGPSDSSTSSSKDLAARAAGEDGTTTSQDALAAEEAETRARERYELAQNNAYQFRKTDPTKVVSIPLEPTLAEAAKKYNVPQDLLTALMLVESGGAHRDADHSMEGGYGVMNLKENNLVDTLAEAANLIGVSEEEVLYNQKVNIEAAAALLARYYEDAVAAGLEGGEAWYMAVSQYSGRPNPQLAAALADEVAGMLMRGMETELNDGGGRVTLPPSSNPIFYPKNWRLAGVTPPPGLANSAEAGGSAPPNPASGGDNQDRNARDESDPVSSPRRSDSASTPTSGL